MKGIKRGRVAVVIIGGMGMVMAPDDATEDEVVAAIEAEEELDRFRGQAQWN